LGQDPQNEVIGTPIICIRKQCAASGLVWSALREPGGNASYALLSFSCPHKERGGAHALFQMFIHGVLRMFVHLLDCVSSMFGDF